MGKRYPRAWKKRYQSKRAALVADRLLGRKKYIPPKFFGGTEILFPLQYRKNININNPRSNLYISGIGGITK